MDICRIPAGCRGRDRRVLGQVRVREAVGGVTGVTRVTRTTSSQTPMRTKSTDTVPRRILPQVALLSIICPGQFGCCIFLAGLPTIL